MRVVTFGEIMGRMSPPGCLRLRQALPGTLDITFAGAEANVAASLAMLGVDACFVSALPENPLADACVAYLRSMGIETEKILRQPTGRLGLYFVEAGANQRPSQVTYDRSGSTVSLTSPEAYNWKKTFAEADWLHISGITPAISELAAAATLEAARSAKDNGLRVSCDLNFRKKLWRWSPGRAPQALAQDTMSQILPYVDVLIANEEDCSDVLGIEPADTDVHAGQLNIERYPDVAKQVAASFPNVQFIGITLRESVSASHNNWGAMLFDVAKETSYFAPLDEKESYSPYPIRNIVDRVGAGDAFAAALIYSLLHQYSPDETIRFAVAASCLAHSIVGDFNFSTLTDIEALIAGSTSGRVVR